MEAVITNGGTREPIDDVRSITNFATGRFGHAIARALAAQEVPTLVLEPHEVTDRLGPLDGVRHEPFTSADSLRTRLLEETVPKIVFQAAAVADYTPGHKADGKISSDQDEMVIRLKRTPKILDELRPHFGQESFLVGFKLLSGVEEHELITAASSQLKRARLNLTVANDLAELRNGQHPVILITAEGGALRLSGERSMVADKLVGFVLRRADVSWYHTAEDKTLHPQYWRVARFRYSPEFCQKANLLYDSSGNVSHRLAGDRLLITPRQVDKSQTTAEDACVVSVDHEEHAIRYRSNGYKSSIDSGVADRLYRQYPGIDSIIHFHDGWGVMGHKTAFPHACGTEEEADEIIRYVGAIQDGDGISVELTHHGFMLGLAGGDVNRLKAQWEDAVAEYRQHILDVSPTLSSITDSLELSRLQADTAHLKPIFSGSDIVGIVAEHSERERAVYLGEEARGKGVGKAIIRQLIDRQLSVATVDDCQVREYYKAHGFTETYDEDSRYYRLTPPTPLKTDPLFA